jgi:hypothetical protein
VQIESEQICVSITNCELWWLYRSQNFYWSNNSHSIGQPGGPKLLLKTVVAANNQTKLKIQLQKFKKRKRKWER